MKKTSFHFFYAVIALFIALLASPAANAQSITQVMSGLDNPRHLAFGPEGALYVAEAGRGHACSFGVRFSAPARAAQFRASGTEFRVES